MSLINIMWDGGKWRILKEYVLPEWEPFREKSLLRNWNHRRHSDAQTNGVINTFKHRQWKKTFQAHDMFGGPRDRSPTNIYDKRYQHAYQRLSKLSWEVSLTVSLEKQSPPSFLNLRLNTYCSIP